MADQPSRRLDTTGPRRDELTVEELEQAPGGFEPEADIYGCTWGNAKDCNTQCKPEVEVA